MSLKKKKNTTTKEKKGYSTETLTSGLPETETPPKPQRDLRGWSASGRIDADRKSVV